MDTVSFKSKKNYLKPLKEIIIITTKEEEPIQIKLFKYQ
jgi:hypothetical protein